MKEDNRIRGFEVALGYEDKGVEIPQRQTDGSAGYDLKAIEEITIEPGKIGLIKTGLKAYMPINEVLVLAVRSSVAIKKGLFLANGIGVIDSDYYSNPENDGHIGVPLFNSNDTPVTIPAGERVSQGIFVNYWTTDNDDPVKGKRTGGVGSTGTN